jgi:hypothetical protein
MKLMVMFFILIVWVKNGLQIAYCYNNMEFQLLKNSARDHKTKLM